MVMSVSAPDADAGPAGSAPGGMVMLKSPSALVTVPPAAPIGCVVAVPIGVPGVVGVGSVLLLPPSPGPAPSSPPPQETRNSATRSHERERFMLRLPFASPR
jgi:hypothetical protein